MRLLQLHHGSTGVIQGWSQATVERARATGRITSRRSGLWSKPRLHPGYSPLLFDLEILNVE
jgi:hypothetical protein